MGLRNMWFLIPTAATLLSACSSFSIQDPKDGALNLPTPTPVTVVASPSMSSLVVKVDGNVSNQINYVSDQQSSGTLTLTPGKHTITAQAAVPCWYCSPNPWQASFQANVCVGTAQSAVSPMTKIPLAKADNLSWSKTSDATVGTALDAGTLMTRWNPIRLGGFASSIALIQSAENGCLCMRSMDAAQNTAIGLAVCDANDATQQWQALQVAPLGAGNYRVQNNGRGVSDACLTEGANNVLVQRACNDTPDQLWSFRDNTTGVIGPPF